MKLPDVARATTAQLATFTPADDELFIDTTKNTIVIGDGSTTGGVPLQTAASVNRALTSLYRRYLYMPVAAMNAGATSGVTYVAPSSSTTGGWNLTADAHVLTFGASIFADWDGSSNPVVDVCFDVNVDNSGGSSGDTVDLLLTAYYGQVGVVAIKTQTVTVSTTVGKAARYKTYKASFTLDRTVSQNQIVAGDRFGFKLNLINASSEVDDIVVIHGGCSISYQTTHMGVESGDI